MYSMMLLFPVMRLLQCPTMVYAVENAREKGRISGHLFETVWLARQSNITGKRTLTVDETIVSPSSFSTGHTDLGRSQAIRLEMTQPDNKYISNVFRYA
jgi:hypothetical protein